MTLERAVSGEWVGKQDAGGKHFYANPEQLLMTWGDPKKWVYSEGRRLFVDEAYDEAREAFEGVERMNGGEDYLVARQFVVMCNKRQSEQEREAEGDESAEEACASEEEKEEDEMKEGGDEDEDEDAGVETLEEANARLKKEERERRRREVEEKKNKIRLRIDDVWDGIKWSPMTRDLACDTSWVKMEGARTKNDMWSHPTLHLTTYGEPSLIAFTYTDAKQIFHAGGRWLKAKALFEDVIALNKGLPFRNCEKYTAVCDLQMDYGVRMEMARPIYDDGTVLFKKGHAVEAMRCFDTVSRILPGKDGDKYRNLREYIRVCSEKITHEQTKMRARIEAATRPMSAYHQRASDRASTMVEGRRMAARQESRTKEAINTLLHPPPALSLGPISIGGTHGFEFDWGGDGQDSRPPSGMFGNEEATSSKGAWPW